jgi:thioredoxin-related protein
MKRSALIIALLVLTCFAADAQEVTYFKKPWEEIKQKAREENKYIFIDCYTDWCGWCKTMDKETMTNEDVITILGENFVAVKMDMEHGEGIKMAMKYHINGFPSFLFFSPEGKYVYHTAGYRKPAEFIKELKGVLNKSKQVSAPGFSDLLEQNYPGIYAAAYAGNGKRSFPKKEEVTSYLNGQADLMSEVNWAVIAKFSTEEKYTKYFLDHVNDYKRLYGKVSVNDKLNSVLGDMLTKATKEKDDKAFKALLIMIDKYMEDEADASKTYCSIAYYKGTENWGMYALTIGDYIKKNGFENTNYINGLCWDLYEHCDDKKTIQKSCSWMKEVTDKDPSYANLDTYASLLYKSGQLKEAGLAANKAIEAGKEAKTDVKATEELLQKIKGNK